MIYGNWFVKITIQFLKFNTLKFSAEKRMEHDMVYADIETQILNFSADMTEFKLVCRVTNTRTRQLFRRLQVF